jgi:hypothetical protein
MLQQFSMGNIHPPAKQHCFKNGLFQKYSSVYLLNIALRTNNIFEVWAKLPTFALSIQGFSPHQQF